MPLISAIPSLHWRTTNTFIKFGTVNVLHSNAFAWKWLLFGIADTGRLSSEHICVHVTTLAIYTYSYGTNSQIDNQRPRGYGSSNEYSILCPSNDNKWSKQSPDAFQLVCVCAGCCVWMCFPINFYFLEKISCVLVIHLYCYQEGATTDLPIEDMWSWVLQ